MTRKNPPQEVPAAKPVTIELFLSPTGWMSRTNDPETFKLFGTDVLPTAFTAKADAAVVLARIKELNPRASVKIAAEVR